jgi:eukaryotic-like serine/threonine-protein kinase
MSMESSAAARVLGGKYRLVRQLEQGGMGSVWYAEHLVLNSPVAVKLLELDDQESTVVVDRFLREAQTAASLRSPHVVQILDYGVDEQTPFIVMELLVGESLAQRLRRAKRLTPAETELVIMQVARAVGRAHDAGVIHRDLKPGNVFVVRDADRELIKVLDFGIAKALASVGTNTQSGTFLGTPAYASPEQVQGVRELDQRTDIWSLGVIAFECLLGTRPFAGDTFGAIVLSVCSRPLPVPSTWGAVPVGFDEWFATACARAPAQRFPSARQAAEALSLVCTRGLTKDVSSSEQLQAHAASALSGQAPTLPDDVDAANGTQRAATLSHGSALARASRRPGWLWAAGAAGALVLGSVVLLRGPDRAPLDPSWSRTSAPLRASRAAPLEVLRVADAGSGEATQSPPPAAPENVPARAAAPAAPATALGTNLPAKPAPASPRARVSPRSTTRASTNEASAIREPRSRAKPSKRPARPPSAPAGPAVSESEFDLGL